MTVEMSDREFEELVSDALDTIPTELTDAMSNVVVLVEGHHPDEPDLLGLYEGIALTQRDTTYGGALPDTITIYREPLLSMCTDRDQVVAEVAITVVHEIAHHFGIDDAWLHAHGWG
ncbi:metallopeptidase family protein [Williamsia sp. MIQD14]|uniref:metallopeptidase family protein n=1 Tax=Williamsia sp. MIQD14 TaxID=3425703 RepID=UPI003DA09946